MPCHWAGEVKKFFDYFSNRFFSSFVQCYSHYFPRLIDDEYGVPLEHYITCVKNVEIVTDQGVIKRVQTTITPSFSVPLNHSK